MTDMASDISWIEEAPVEMIRGFPVSQTLSIKGRSTISGEAILYAFESSSSRRSTALKSKGVEKIEIPIFFAWEYSFSCHSHGVEASSYNSNSLLFSHKPSFTMKSSLLWSIVIVEALYVRDLLE